MSYPDCGPEDEMRRTEELDAQQRAFEENNPLDDSFYDEETDPANLRDVDFEREPYINPLDVEEAAHLDSEYFGNYEVINGLPRSDAEAIEADLSNTVDQLQRALHLTEEEVYYYSLADEYEYWDNYERVNGLPSVADRNAEAHPIRTAIAQGLRSVADWFERIS